LAPKITCGTIVIAAMSRARIHPLHGHRILREDARGVLELGRDLDRTYIERWASELGVLDLWCEIAGGETGGP